MADANKLGHVKINGKYYRIDLPSYQGKDIIDFSPRASTPGGGQIMSELGLYQPVYFTDWRHGFGFQWHTDSMGYLRTEGQIDPRHGGLAMLFTDITISDTTDTHVLGFLLMGSNLFAWHETGAKYFNGTVWADCSPTASTKINAAWTNGKDIFAAVDGAKIKSSSDLASWAEVGVNSNSIDYHWLEQNAGYIFAGKQKNGSSELGNQVYYASETDLSDMHGDPDDDTNVLYVGTEGVQVLGATEFLGDLVFFRPDGIYRMDKDRKLARKVVDYEEISSPDNFRSFVVYNNMLIFSVRDRLYQWNGTRLSDITPPKINDTFPYTTYGRFDNFVVVGRHLYMTARSTDTTYKEVLLCFDGVGWFRLHDLVTDGTSTVSAMHYDSSRDYLWFHVHSSGAESTRYIPFRSLSEYPYADFPTSGQHSLFSPRIDAGFRRVIKSSPSIIVEGTNLDSGTYLKVFYSIDGGAWTAWGGTDGVTNIVNSSGVTELSDPEGTTDSTLEFYHIQIRIDFVTDDSTQTPVLEGYTLRVLMRPETYYGYSMMVSVAEGIEYGGKIRDSRSPKQQEDDLRSARDSKAPIEFVDMWGVSRQVYMTAVTDRAITTKPTDRGGTPNIEKVVQINLVEVG